ncbi:MAG TPA: TIGR03663 family protein [Anaerolineae bacterium]|nr:TIGR03663 family protein [Anaerolineae bacterium]
MTTMETRESKGESWLDRKLNLGIRLDVETILIVAMLILAILTRFYDLETRVMSHDESLHTYFSWTLSEGRGFEHTPLMHGPLQFHVVALSYFLFGDSDATARIPAAAASVLAVGMIWLFRRWLGRTGALVAMGLMLISPYMLYYGRYVRNEALILPMALLTVYSMFRYVETRRSRWLYLFALSLSLHFTTKETSFIYTAIFMIFLAGHLTWRLISRPWKSVIYQIGFLLGLAVGFSGVGLAMFSLLGGDLGGAISATETIQPLDPTSGFPIATSVLSPYVGVGLILVLVGLLLVGLSLVLSFGKRLRTEFPTLDLLLICSTMVLPQLGAFPARLGGWDPLAYDNPEAFTRTTIVVVILIVISAAFGLLWDWRRWLVAASVFFVPFVIFQTTVLTNPSGLASGLVGSLGYWLEQQSVHRGSQPWYYYLVIQIPFYEYLPAIGALLAVFVGLFRNPKPRSDDEESAESSEIDWEAGGHRFPVIGFLGYWSILMFGGFTIASERMPWLTVHIALPMILLAGWTFGAFLESIDWRVWLQKRAWLLGLLLALTMLSFTWALGYGLGNPAPFQGSEIPQLQVTLGFSLSLVLGIVSLFVLALQASQWSPRNLFKLAGLIVLVALTLLTARTSFRAAYINYDDPTEFMVYAHAATGVKTVMNQVEDLSLRMTDGLGVDIGYDDDVSWPFQWYLRDYTNPHFFGKTPSRELLQYPLVVAGNDNWNRVDPVLGDRYHVFEYNRMWWPMQDYFGLTWERILNAIRSPEMRAALWNIWLDRDYTSYIHLTGRSLTLERWYNADRMRLYIRKDTGALVWDYNMNPSQLPFQPGEDPYTAEMVEMQAVSVIGDMPGTLPGQFQHPRDVAIAPDGTLFVADTENHRIQHLSPEGEVLDVWGEFGIAAADVGSTDMLFNGPWGIGVGPDGSVYVADTWNNRVQHFTAEGVFLGSVGTGGYGETSGALWGPRDVAVDARGRVFVADTGNKRILIFDEDLTYLGEFGGGGAGLGKLDEPVGLAIDQEGRVYVADTWNLRVQVFEEISDHWFVSVLEWPIEGWYGESLDNKPYLSYSRTGHICVSDPEGFVVLCFTTEGEYVRGWGGLGASDSRFGLPSGLDFDGEGAVWVVDSANSRLMNFVPDLP